MTRTARWFAFAALAGLVPPAAAQEGTPPGAPREAEPRGAAGASPGEAPRASDQARGPAQPFWFGSYGRLAASTDEDGGRGKASQIVAFGPRLIQGNYLELDFGYRAWEGPAGRVHTLVTLALGDRFFHYDGDFELASAIRQAYVEADDLLQETFGEGVFVWVGSRMYRGDDVYLLDFWPMDDLNTFGAGFGWRGPENEVAVHGGFNRLEDAYQVQRISIPGLRFGTAEAEVLDRQRSVISLKLEQRFGGGADILGMKVRLYGELHRLPKGRRTIPGSISETEPLPDDLGFLAGAQLGLWNFGRNAHLNVWLRYAAGLAAYGELAEPFGLNRDRRSVDAREYRAAVSGNFEHDVFGVLYGGYARMFLDADGEDEDFDDRLEYAVVARPMLFLGIFTPGIEASFQASRPNGLNPRTLGQQTATVTQIGVVPALTFGDEPGSYTRPQLRLIYAVSLLNEAALAFYPADDPRATRDVVHYVGVGAEWWYGRGGGY